MNVLGASQIGFYCLPDCLPDVTVSASRHKAIRQTGALCPVSEINVWNKITQTCYRK